MRKDILETTESIRPPDERIPKTKEDRQKLLAFSAEYVQSRKLVAPLPLDQLRIHSDRAAVEAGVDGKYADFLAVLLNNELWRKTVAATPYEKRLLLLPKCMRHQENCQGQLDEYGLICAHCGQCSNDDLKSQAEELGYAVLIAEGSPIVMSLIESGKIEVVIGVSCLSVLERTFPYMEAGAIPGIAIPLLQDGCANTSVDIEWVWDAIYDNSEDQSKRLNLDQIKNEVESWFEEDSLAKLICEDGGEVEKLGLEWLSKAGKRWRPFLAACTFEALRQQSGAPLPKEIHKAAVAVECFHKASLIHDDIEDGDTLRYGEQTMHDKWGIPIALNVGDFLLGEGYRLLASIEENGDRTGQMLLVAAQGHRSLCIGQGRELAWVKEPTALKCNDVIEIYKKKTSPAFAVALKMGAILAGSDKELYTILARYSESLGIAYQIKDDIGDFSRAGASDINAVRPSLMLSLAYEKAEAGEKELFEKIWQGEIEFDDVFEEVIEIFSRLNIEQAALCEMANYKSDAISALSTLENGPLKQFLRRVIGKIFNDIEIMGCCNEYKKPDDSGSKDGPGQPGQ